MAHPTWTPDEEHVLIDTYSVLTAKAQAAQLGRDVKDVVAKRMRMLHQGRFDGHRRAYLPEWTEQEDEWLRDNYHRYTMRTLVRRLNRTESAIVLRKAKLGIHRTDGMYTAREVGRIFGWDAKRVVDLREQGYIKGGRAPYLQGKNRPWAFTERAVIRFLRTYPWLVPDVHRVTEHYFTGVLREEWKRDPWLTTQEAAALLRVNDATLRARYRTGEVPAHQRSPGRKWSEWWVRRSVLLAHFRLKHRGEERATQAREAIHARRRRAGLPVRVALVWHWVCQECGEMLEVRTGPKGQTREAVAEACRVHPCGQEGS